MFTKTKSRSGYSLIEVLVSISIMGILLAIIIPAVQAARSSSRRTTCQNKMRQLGVGLASFETAHRHFPSGKTTISTTQPQFSWSAQLLPFLEQEALWTQLKQVGEKGVPDSLPAPGIAVLQSAVQCPSDSATAKLQRSSKANGTFVALGDYLGVAGQNYLSRDGVFFLDSKTTTGAIRDGLSNTLFVGERPPSADNNFGWWFTGEGQDGTGNLDLFLGMEELNSGNVAPLNEFDAGPHNYRNGTPDSFESVFHFWSHHSGGANFLFGDGSVKLLSYDTDRKVLREMSTRSGNWTERGG